MDPSLSNLAPPPLPPPAQYHPFLPFFPPPPTAALPNEIQFPNFLAPPPPPIANPAPPVPENPYQPSYSEMIYSAIAALNEPDGSSKIAIAKYIERAFSDLPPINSALLTHHLKRMKNEGSIILVKKSYKLPRSDVAVPDTIVAVPVGSDAAQASVGPKKGRGRPPKPKPNGPVPVLNGPEVIMNNVFGPDTESEPIMNVTEPVYGSVLGKRGRGRPPKSGPRPPLGIKKSPSGGRVGRPPKPNSVHSPSPFKRGRGRPAKSVAQAQPQQAPAAAASDIVSTQAAELFDVGVAGSPNVRRTSGRPRKTVAAGGGGGDVVAVVAGKRGRGRPPRVGAIISPPKPKYTAGSGRPVGRPKKNASVTSQAVDQVAYDDLKSKLEFFQSRIVQAVAALKTRFMNQHSISGIAALHELEGLAAMDLNSPFQEEPEPQLVVEEHNQPPPFTERHPFFQNQLYNMQQPGSFQAQAPNGQDCAKVELGQL